MNEKFENFIKRYGIRIIGENLGAEKHIAKHPEDVAFLKSNKQEIIAYIREKEEASRKAYDEFCTKVEAIEGLKEIKTARYSWYDWCKRFSESFDGEYAVGGMGIEKPVYTEYVLNALYKKYPRATAYLKAESWKNSTHWFKSKLGEEATHRIAEGEDYSKIITEMETKWAEYRAENID